MTDFERPSQTSQTNLEARLGNYQSAVESALRDLSDENIVARIWQHDHTVWKPDPTEISNRLGWLHSPDTMAEHLPEIEAFVQEVRSEGYTQALLLGMGGSSLAPEVFRFTFGVGDGYLDLRVLDSTDPGAILNCENQLDLARTLFLVSTKSGGTVETLSLFKYFYSRVASKVGRAGVRFVAITDPGSSLVDLAEEHRFRKTFLNDPNIGGRYSALSYFGLVPAALLGMDLEKLLNRARAVAQACTEPVSAADHPAWLGAALAVLAVAGRDKLTLVASPEITHFGAWLEQLVAESAGKEAKGILPVDGEEVGLAENYGSDRLFVNLAITGDDRQDQKLDALAAAGHPVIQIELRDRYDLGGEFFRWEVATAIACWRLGVNPFDQPNVESAKVVAKKMVAAFQEEGQLPELTPTLETDGIQVYGNANVANVDDALTDFLTHASLEETEEKRGYVAMQAYVTATPEVDAALHLLRLRIRDKTGLATTVGYGPRFLHSTGQLHKGDGGTGLFIQITGDSAHDVDIPDKAGEKGSSITFGVLKMAQALGDRQALIDAERKVIRFHFRGEVASGLGTLLS